jgi:ATP-dependent HslUV protease ATP-binding subunit HslU
MSMSGFTPRETVSELDRYIVGQGKAKRAVAIALRNRWRRRQLEAELQQEVSPKNIIMIGPTGVGKTEIARRLAQLSGAPFVKVEASKFTEVGYVGRDVESMIRDLVETSIKLVKADESERIKTRATQQAETRLVHLIIEQYGKDQAANNYFAVGPDGAASRQGTVVSQEVDEVRRLLRQGELNHLEVTTVLSPPIAAPNFEIVGAAGMEEMMSGLKDAFSNLQGTFGGAAAKEQKLPVQEALEALLTEESDRLVDMDRVQQLALERAQEEGIVFLDEIDKIAMSHGRGGGQGPDVSRGGVQRDLLPIVEGCTVNTKYGTIRTDHILFIAAGAFHEAKVSDLAPELQGRFPIRVELEPLGEDEFFRILTEPKNSLVRQYQALLATEGVDAAFTESGVRALAHVAYTANTRLENIGARRLHTVLESVLEEISFKAPELKGTKLEVTSEMVQSRIEPILEDEDLSRYIL